MKLAERMNEYGTSNPDILRKAVGYAEGKKSFPAPGSVGIVDDIIVLVLDEKAVDIARTRLAPAGHINSRADAAPDRRPDAEDTGGQTRPSEKDRK